MTRIAVRSLVRADTWDYLFTVSRLLTAEGPPREVQLPYRDRLLWHYAYLMRAPVCQSPQPQ